MPDDLNIAQIFEMRRFHCDCGHPIFFDNSICLSCGLNVGFDPETKDILTLGNAADDPTASRKACANLNPCGCNWLLPADSPETLCDSCLITRTIPALASAENQRRWLHLESAKRRLLLTLLDLGLWGRQSNIHPALPLAFDFKESVDPAAPVFTGHENGVITLNIVEADPDQRERVRTALQEPYRTVLGHLRHESGHYFWDLLVQGSACLDECRALFGDESTSYDESMRRYYADGPAANWADTYISAYASMHPWEDWAETWAHCLHMTDTLETANQAGLTSKTSDIKHDPADFVGIAGATASNAADFAMRAGRWRGLVILVNEISRSMGQPDVYPFPLTVPVLRKLFFVERVIQASTK